MDYFYDGQIRRYITQFIRLMSNFAYQDGSGKLIQVPVRYGDMTRQVAQILKKNSENTVPSAPFIACYIKDFKFDKTRLQDPTFVSKINVRERDVDANGNLLYTQGANYTVERIMPSPYKITFAADIWTSNTDQKFQLIEQIACIFNPSLDLQTTDNYIDWTSLSTLTLTDQGQWSSRQIPQGVEQDIEISTMVFETPVWITPPAKVKRLNIITKIIHNVFQAQPGQIAGLEAGYAEQIFTQAQTVITAGNFDLLVLDNVAILLDSGTDGTDGDTVHSWLQILDLYPGQFKANLSQLRMTKPDGNEVVAYVSLDPTDETRMLLTYDVDTVPSNSIIGGRGTIDAIIDPDKFNPKSKVEGTRYLILEDINAGYLNDGYDGPKAWKNSDDSNFVAYANNIVEWDGTDWNVIFNSAETTAVTYITNSYTGVQYKWDGESWSKSFEGIYDKSVWRLVM